jgi:HPr serine kinase-like protein
VSRGSEGSWWHDPDRLSVLFDDAAHAGVPCDWYRIGDGYLGIESEDLRFRARYRNVYGECLESSPPIEDARPRLHCCVRVVQGVPAYLVTFTASEEIDIVDFVLGLFGGRGYVENGGVAGWRVLGSIETATPVLASKGNRVLVEPTQPWQSVIANCAFNWLLRMQRDLLFFHAATVGVGGAGVLITGSKGAGKSTLSMALASRGHDFLGDEIAAVRKRGHELLAVRRAVSIRPGPQAPTLQRILERRAYPAEQFPDGSTRVRAEAGELFPGLPGRSLPLRLVFFLCGFEERPRAELHKTRSADLRLLTPLACTFWKTSPAPALMQVAELLSSVKCYLLHPGMPEDTALLVERIASES